MSCYFRHMKEVFEEAGVKITKENKKEIDRILHSLVDVEYKNCSPTWKAIKEQIKGDDKAWNRFVKRLKDEVKKEEL
jgi:uncharacterized protein YeaO (DUF488 family)